MNITALITVIASLVLTMSCKEATYPVKIIPYKTYVAIEHPFYGDCKGNIIQYKIYADCVLYVVDSVCTARTIHRDTSVPNIELWVLIEGHEWCPHEQLPFKIID